MIIKISDMMNNFDSIPIEIQEKDVASADKIKEAVMKKIHKESVSTKVTRNISKVGIVAAVLAAALCITAAAGVLDWNGFSFTSGMSKAEKDELIEKVAIMGCTESVDIDGTVHYFDNNGEEILVLSKKEAAKFEEERQMVQEQAVIQSTELVDVATMKIIPRNVAEVTVNADGSFEDFALGNGSVILLHPEEKAGFDLKEGNEVTLQFEANDNCILEFGMFKDGTFFEAETVKTMQHSYNFSIEEDGLYCFYVEYYSSDVSYFTDCMLTIG